MANTSSTGSDANQYIPGTCNIGKAEIETRKRFMGAVTIILIIAMIVFELAPIDPVWRLLVFFPLAALFVNGQQVYFKFCVNFGLRGLYNFSDVGKTYTVEQKEYARRDRTKAWAMIVSSVIVATVVAWLYSVAPF